MAHVCLGYNEMQKKKQTNISHRLDQLNVSLFNVSQNDRIQKRDTQRVTQKLTFNYDTNIKLLH